MHNSKEREFVNVMILFIFRRETKKIVLYINYN